MTFPLPPGVTSATWTSSITGGASATSAGSGAISDTVNVPVGASITYTVVAKIPVTETGSLTTTATVTPAAGVTDSNLANNSASDTDTQAPGLTFTAGYPQITGNLTSPTATSYNAATGLFTSTSVPSAVRFSSSTAPVLIAAPPPSRSTLWSTTAAT